MCQNPFETTSGHLVACQQCKKCRRNWVSDWIGRGVAEANTAAATIYLTLTYKGDGPETVLLNYKHVQDAFKVLRKRGHKFRYIVAGEYGKKRGRAHWHVMMFFQAKHLPDIPSEGRFKNVDWWRWGHVQQGAFRHETIQYVLKYALKDVQSQRDWGRQSRNFYMSKGNRSRNREGDGPIGAAYFEHHAATAAKNGQALPSRYYPGNRDKDGKLRFYYLKRASYDRALKVWAAQWAVSKPNTPMPYIERLDCQTQKRLREAQHADARQHLAEVATRTPDKRYRVKSNGETYTFFDQGTQSDENPTYPVKSIVTPDANGLLSIDNTGSIWITFRTMARGPVLWRGFSVEHHWQRVADAGSAQELRASVQNGAPLRLPGNLSKSERFALLRRLHRNPLQVAPDLCQLLCEQGSNKSPEGQNTSAIKRLERPQSKSRRQKDEPPF